MPLPGTNFTRHFDAIDHKFPEVGHTYLDSDRDLGRIEKVLRKHENVYTAEQYRDIIREASTKSTVVIDMENHFWNLTDLQKKLNIKNSTKMMKMKKFYSAIALSGYGSNNMDPISTRNAMMKTFHLRMLF